MNTRTLLTIIVASGLPWHAIAQSEPDDEGPFENPMVDEAVDAGVTALSADEPDELADDRREGALSQIPTEALVPDTMSGERHCDVELEAPSLCAWARSADAVVFARIDVLDLVVEGAVADDGRDGWRVFPECRSANPALVIGLSVDRVLSGEAPDRIDLVVGAEQVSRFNPLPLRASDDGLVWTRSSDPLTGPLTVGAHMVVPAHRLDNSWSLKGDVLLGVDSEGRVHLPQRTGDCLNTLPPEIGGLAVNDLGGLLSQCSEIEPMLAERRDLRESLWGRGQMPSFSLSAKCTDPLDNVAEKTVTDRSRPDNTAVEHSEERR